MFTGMKLVDDIDKFFEMDGSLQNQIGKVKVDHGGDLVLLHQHGVHVHLHLHAVEGLGHMMHQMKEHEKLIKKMVSVNDPNKDPSRGQIGVEQQCQ